jgi:uncharacterized protein
MPSKTLEVVVKLTERCNINCTYCYVFNKGDETFKEHPPLMPLNVVDAMGSFLNDAAEKTGATEVIVIFHGGEPLIMKKRKFDQVCTNLRALITAPEKLRFCIQTNGMLVDEEWIELFDKHQIAVGVSIDGPKEENDRYRIDHQGRGTYDRVAKGIHLLREARDEGLIPGMGVLSVANPRLDGGLVYRHFVDELKLDNFDFLLPIDPHDGFNYLDNEGYSRFLCQVFDEWVRDNNPIVSVRIIAKAISALKSGKRLVEDVQNAYAGGHAVFTVASNGDLGPDDTLRTAYPGLFGNFNVLSAKYEDYVSSPLQKRLVQAEMTLPTDCADCSWKNVCRGGAANGRLINRFSHKAGFNNTSVVCDALQKFYGHVAAYLLKSGLSYKALEAGLIQSDATFGSYAAPCPFASNSDASRKSRIGERIPIAVSA